MNCTWPGSQAEVCPNKIGEYQGMVYEAGPYETLCEDPVQVATCMPTPDGIDGCYYWDVVPCPACCFEGWCEEPPLVGPEENGIGCIY